MARPKDDKKREEIIKSAFEIFGKKGFESTTIKDIAEKSGVAAGSIYNYFQNKEELFKAVVTEGWDSFLEEMENINRANIPISQKFQNLLDYGFETLKNFLPLLNGMLFKANQRRLLQEKLDKLILTIEKMIITGKRDGLLKISDNPKQVKSVIKMTTVGVLFSVALTVPEKIEEEIDILKETIKNLFSDRITTNTVTTPGIATSGITK